MALVVGCAGAAESPHEAPLGFDSCDDIAASGGWKNNFLPQAPSQVYYAFSATPTESAGRPIDAVVGFSNGPVDAFADMGPIVRFNAQGFVDARNGSSYQAANSFAYRIGATYRVEIEANIATRTYDTFVYEDAPGQERIQIANQFAFRTEQRAIERLDNIGRKIDSATGSLDICGFLVAVKDNHVLTRAGDGWAHVAFPAKSGRFRAELDAVARAQEGQPDLVIGLSRATPRYFSDLAAIVRFNPAGYFDVRDGSAYGYDSFHLYEVGQHYHFIFDVDVATKTYSVSAWRWGVSAPMYSEPGEPMYLARNYAFRTEQRLVSSLAAMGQIVDSPTGSLFTDELTISY